MTSINISSVYNMSVHIKTSDELKKMRVAGKLAAEVLEMIEPYVLSGVSTEELNTICHNYIVNEQKAIQPLSTTKVFQNLYVHQLIR